MRAAVLGGDRQGVEVAEVELAAPRAGEVEVAIAATGVLTRGFRRQPPEMYTGEEEDAAIASGAHA